MISEELYNALVAYEQAVKLESPPESVRVFGLCTWVGLATEDARIDELRAQLISDFDGDWAFPFGGPAPYMKRAREEAQHRNPARLAWVRSKIEEYEAAHK